MTKRKESTVQYYSTRGFVGEMPESHDYK
jgi:hypothetical protein